AGEIAKKNPAHQPEAFGHTHFQRAVEALHDHQPASHTLAGENSRYRHCYRPQMKKRQHH
ncbi:hypothetical protein, partial [Pseudomonas syringae group genomosp. 7]|uniref:hypothetical protein n=1 Tax=Pseudomonas syringae group genomosp. 7 TaxID=251699 RepID=UPI00377025B1